MWAHGPQGMRATATIRAQATRRVEAPADADAMCVCCSRTPMAAVRGGLASRANDAKCCSACRGDAAGSATFEVPEMGGAQHDCAWAANEDSAYRCSLETVLAMCCETCARAVPSEEPSLIPSTSPSLEPSYAPTLLESSMPTQIPTSAPSMTPSNLPTSAPSKAPNDTVAPSNALVSCPTQNFLGTAIKFVFINLCWKAELFENGVLAEAPCTHC